MTDHERIERLKSEALGELRAAQDVIEQPDGETIVALRMATKAGRMLDEVLTEEHRA